MHLLRNFALFIIFFSYMIFSSASWIVRKFGQVTYEQIVFHMNVPMETETKLINSFLQNTVMMALIITIIAWFISKKISPKKMLAVAGVMFALSLVFAWQKMSISDILHEYKSRSVMSNFYEEHYADPHNIELTTPNNKRNLIMIFAESMESTYAYPEYFGDNLIPELSEIAKDNINFSDTENLGGFKNVIGAQYTQASMVAQLCAIPFRLPVRARRFHPINGFLPGAVCLSDILKKDDYNQSFMIGMTRQFCGTDSFLETHGNVKILDWDFYSARDNLKRNADKKRRGIVRDINLFKYAKEEILELASKDAPFSFTIMTMDTHFGNEHFEKQICSIKYHDDGIDDEDNFKNVYSCADQQISDFINWIKEQPFYANTEIVVVGDHFTMGEVKFEDDWNRSVYDVYINSALKNKEHTQNRRFTALDTLPTILESMGYILPGHKIGLGVSLFSGEKTLLEEIGDIDTLSEQLNMQSAIYNKILYGNDPVEIK